MREKRCIISVFVPWANKVMRVQYVYVIEENGKEEAQRDVENDLWKLYDRSREMYVWRNKIGIKMK